MVTDTSNSLSHQILLRAEMALSSPSSTSSVPAASAAVLKVSAASLRRANLSIPSKPKKLILLPDKVSRIDWNRSSITKAQLNEVDANSNEDLPLSSLSEEAVSEFISQVASLVKLVDSRDIMELQLKQLNFELTIRKKEALPQPQPPHAPSVMMHPTLPPPSMQFAPPPASAPPQSPAVPSTAPPNVVSGPKPSKSSHAPLKSPMAGTFYRSPGPGFPPFVKPGDKVNKGQVLCIIEAMKLMNEIEADQSGTVVEILAEDGKPVSVDQPIIVIEH